MSSFSRHFQKAIWTGGSWGSGEFNPGDLSPASVILNLAYTRCREDALLQRLFTRDRIEMMAVRNAREFGALPRLQLYLGSLAEQRIATKLDLSEILMYCGIRMSEEDAIRVVDPGVCYHFEALDAVVRVLKDYQDSRVQLEGLAYELPMSKRSFREGELSYIEDVDESSGRKAITFELPWLYIVDVDADTGTIKNQLLMP